MVIQVDIRKPEDVKVLWEGTVKEMEAWKVEREQGCQ